MTSKNTNDFEEINIPQTSIRPANRRILVHGVTGKSERKTDSNIILLNRITSENKGKATSIDIRRYFVVALDPDIEIMVDSPNASSGQRKLQRGDEVFTFYPVDAISYNLPVVADPVTGYQFEVFHETEIAGTKAWEMEVEEIKKITHSKYELFLVN